MAIMKKKVWKEKEEVEENIRKKENEGAERQVERKKK